MVLDRIRLWNGEKSRPLQLALPCSCGCDGGQTEDRWGYLTGSDAAGNGFTLWLGRGEFAKLASCMQDAFKMGR
jgi:hypothetical protein